MINYEDKIADNIKNLRARYGITQAELAEIVGTSAPAISKWEHGETIPRMGAIEKMAQHFKISKSAILDGSFVSATDERAELLDKAFDGRPEMRMLFSVAENASKEDIEKAIKILEALKG